MNLHMLTLSSEHGNLLLLKVAPVFLVNKHQVQVVPRRELFVHVYNKKTVSLTTAGSLTRKEL